MHIKAGEIYLADGGYYWGSTRGVNKIKPDGSSYTSVIDSGIGNNGITGVAVDWIAGLCCNNDMRANLNIAWRFLQRL